MTGNKMEWNDIIDRHKNESCFICAHGPSLNDVSSHLKYFKEKNIRMIGCNEWYDFYDVIPNYWICCSTSETIKNRRKKINEYKIPFLYSYCPDKTEDKWIQENIKSDYFPYVYLDCESPICFCGNCNRKNQDISLPKKLMEYCGYDEKFIRSDTVLIQMISFSILMGFANIFIFGAELDLKKGYAIHKKDTYLVDEIPSGYFDNRAYEAYLDANSSRRFLFDNSLNDIMETLNIIGKSAKKKGIKIYNLSERKYDEFINLEQEDMVNQIDLIIGK